MLQMLLSSRQEHDRVVPTGGTGLSLHEAHISLSLVKERKSSINLDGAQKTKVNPVQASMPTLTEMMMQLHNRKKNASAPPGAGLPKDLMSAYDRMRTRKCAYLILKGMNSTAAAYTAEEEAMESLAVLAKERGIAAVATATGSTLWKRRSCVENLLRRRSIATAAAESISNADVTETRQQHLPEAPTATPEDLNTDAVETKPQHLPDTPTATSESVFGEAAAPYVRTRLRRRASLIARAAFEPSKELENEVIEALDEEVDSRVGFPTTSATSASPDHVSIAGTRKRLCQRAVQLLGTRAPKRHRRS